MEAALVRDPGLAELCQESGWSVEPLADDALAVDLATPGAYLAARLRAEGGELVADCELARVPAQPPVCRAALARLLERAGECFCGVDAASDAEGEAVARLEVRCAAEPEALAAALDALAVAARRCAREARALAADAALARAWLDHHTPR